MANYRSGEVIKRTRMAIGMTQEELSEGVCSVKTLSRIENGLHHVKKETYRQLMERMERMPGKNYAICMGSELELLEERVRMEGAIVKYDYQTASECLQRIKKKTDGKILNQQYIKKMEIIIDFYNQKMDKTTQVEKMEKMVAEMIPEYKKYIESFYPFTEQEILVLMNLGNAYQRAERHEESIQIYKMILRCLNIDYMDETVRMQLKAVNMRNLARVYGGMGEYKKSIALCKKAMDLSRDCNYGVILPIALLDIAWCITKQVEKKEVNEELLKEAKWYMCQAYYIACARSDSQSAMAIAQFYESYFKQNIETFI